MLLGSGVVGAMIGLAPEAGIASVEDQGIDVACLRNLHGKIDDRLEVVASE